MNGDYHTPVVKEGWRSLLIRVFWRYNEGTYTHFLLARFRLNESSITLICFACFGRAGRSMIPTTGQRDPWSLPQGREPSSRRWQDQVSAIPRYLVEIKVTTPQRSIISCHFSCHVRPWQPQDIVLLIDRLTGLQLCMVLETAWRGLLVERTWRELHSVVWPLTH